MILIVQWLGLLALGAWVTWWDRRTRTIPHYGLIAAVLSFALLHTFQGHGLAALVGGLDIAGIGFILWWLMDMGGGDIKYWIVLGVALGVTGAFVVMAGAAAGALVWGIVSGDWKRQGRHGTLAFGPWLAGMSVVVGAPIHWFHF